MEDPLPNLARPDELRPINSLDSVAFSRIEYEQHPAYAPLVANAGFVTKVVALTSFIRKFVPLLVKRAIRYEMIPNHVRKQGGLKFVGWAARNILRIESRPIVKNATFVLVEQMEREGVVVTTIPHHSIVALEQASNAQFEQLRARRGDQANRKRGFDESRSSVDRRHESALFDRVESILFEAGVINAASAYLGRLARLVDVNPQINDISDGFWREVFPDICKQPLPETAYFHRDASGGDIKAIIYLTDVGLENGPFTYVLGSHRCSRGSLDDLICETNDHGLSDTDPGTRKLFAALPAALRKKGSFGNDVLPSSTLARELIGGSWQIVSEKGSIVLFDTKGVHRGGMVEVGERLVITCVLG